jgi:hypothetical protein
MRQTHPSHRAHRVRRVHRSGRPARLALVLAPLLAVGIIVSGCSDDSDDAGRQDTSGNVNSGSANSDNLSSDGGDNASDAAATDVVAVDYHFEGLPERIDAGSRLAMHNDSAREVHELVAMAIPEGETRSVDELMALPEGELFAALPGQPALVMLAPPGEDAIPVLGDGTLDAGRYLVLCAIPTGADPDELMREAQQSQGGPPNVPGGPPHFTAGMYAELVAD